MRPRSAVARGGSAAAHGKRNVFPERVNAPYFFSSYVAVYVFLANNTKIVKEIIRSVLGIIRLTVLGIIRLTVLTCFIGEKYHSLDKFMSKFHRKF